MDNANNTLDNGTIVTDLCQQMQTAMIQQSVHTAANNGVKGDEKVQLTNIPCNAITGKPYQGMNIIMLWSAARDANFESHEWATFKQWSSKNESIREGEEGTVIVHYSFKENNKDKTKAVTSLKLSRVFNRSQLQSWRSE